MTTTNLTPATIARLQYLRSDAVCGPGSTLKSVRAAGELADRVLDEIITLDAAIERARKGAAVLGRNSYWAVVVEILCDVRAAA